MAERRTIESSRGEYLCDSTMTSNQNQPKGTPSSTDNVRTSGPRDHQERSTTEHMDQHTGRRRRVVKSLVGSIMALQYVRATTGFLTGRSYKRTWPNRGTRQSMQYRCLIEKGAQPMSLGSLFLPQYDGPIDTIAAPMVAASDFAFRCLCRKYGTDLTFTQMLHTENLLLQETFRKNHLDLWEYTTLPAKWSREQLEFLDGSSRTDMTTMNDHVGSVSGPVIVQLAGHDPKRVAEAARLIYDHTEGRIHGFDLNLGTSLSGMMGSRWSVASNVVSWTHRMSPSDCSQRKIWGVSNGA